MAATLGPENWGDVFATKTLKLPCLFLKVLYNMTIENLQVVSLLFCATFVSGLYDGRDGRAIDFGKRYQKNEPIFY